uniref:Uncharacterized protein n=1 Tax=Globodera rostochiensis TaxID=31243 RepID=A0A914GU94_GLORO
MSERASGRTTKAAEEGIWIEETDEWLDWWTTNIKLLIPEGDGRTKGKCSETPQGDSLYSLLTCAPGDDCESKAHDNPYTPIVPTGYWE